MARTTEHEEVYEEVGEADNKRLLLLCYRVLIGRYGFSGTQLVEALRGFQESDMESHLVQGIEISLIEFS